MPPVTIPHVCVCRPLSVVNRRPPDTSTGETRSVVVKSPSAPLLFRPQQYATPTVVSAHENPLPVSMDANEFAPCALMSTSGRFGDVALIVFTPDAAPSVHAPTRATPLASVVCVAPVIEPPPATTVNVTAIPETNLLFGSRTTTLGGVESGPLAVPVVLPSFCAICVAASVVGTVVASPPPHAPTLTS